LNSARFSAALFDAPDRRKQQAKAVDAALISTAASSLRG
jgi:hypothetical protein